MKKLENCLKELLKEYENGNEKACKIVIGCKTKCRPVMEYDFYIKGFTTIKALIAAISDKVSYFNVGNQKWETGDKFRSLLYIKSYDLMKVVYI